MDEESCCWLCNRPLNELEDEVQYCKMCHIRMTSEMASGVENKLANSAGEVN